MSYHFPDLLGLMVTDEQNEQADPGPLSERAPNDTDVIPPAPKETQPGTSVQRAFDLDSF